MMIHFKGVHEARNDGNGRIWVPYPYNRKVKAIAIFTNEFIEEEVQDRLRYVILCPLEEFGEFSPYLSAEKVYTCAVKNSGRVYVPESMRDYANIGSDVMIVGTRETMELWDRNCWESYERDLMGR